MLNYLKLIFVFLKLDRLFRLLGELSYSQKQFEENLKGLVSTFELTADTITFRPNESGLVLVFLFYL